MSNIHNWWLPGADNTTQKNWVLRPAWESGGSQLHNYTFDSDIGIDPTPPRFPLNPNDRARYLVYDSGPDRVDLMTAANYRLYKGVTLNPEKVGKPEQVMEKNAKALIPVGSEAVQNGDFTMTDINPQYGDVGTDQIPQRIPKQWRYRAATAITAAIDNVAGYAIGATVLQIDTISTGFALRPGRTISITTGGTARYYLIESIDYTLPTAAGTDAIITLAWGLSVAVVNNDVITTAHAASAPIFFNWHSEFSENLHSIENAQQLDVSVGPPMTALELPVVDFNPAGIAAGTIAIVPSGAGGVYSHPGGARGGVGIQLGNALASADVVELEAWFYDKIIRQQTIGQAAGDGAARTSATEADEVKTELKC
jgi:hypothetical protein